EDPGVLKVGHNIKVDLETMDRHGVAIAPIDDTMLISYVLEGSAHGHETAELSELHLGHKTIAYDTVCGSGKARIGFEYAPLDKARDYGAEAGDVMLRLHQLLKPRLIEQRLVTVYETIERPLVPVVAGMETVGIKVDREELHRLSREFAERLTELEAQIYKLAGHSFNIGSPKQLGEVLF